MDRHKVALEAGSNHDLADAARKVAYRLDPWHVARRAAFWFALGACAIAAMDYGDVWICVGQCNAMIGK